MDQLFKREEIGPNLTIEKILDRYREWTPADEDREDMADGRPKDIDLRNRLKMEKEVEERLCGPKGSIRDYSDEFTALFDEMKAKL